LVEPAVVPKPINYRARAVIPGLALSLFLSTASILGDPLRILHRDASVVAGRRALQRRRISISEARQIALDAIRSEEARYSKAAEREGREFRRLFNWETE
jgi:hypothetical protein